MIDYLDHVRPSGYLKPAESITNEVAKMEHPAKYTNLSLSSYLCVVFKCSGPDFVRFVALLNNRWREDHLYQLAGPG